MGLRMHRQVGALRKVLSQQTIGVLVRSALPRALRIAKIDVDVGRQRKATMIFGSWYSARRRNDDYTVAGEYRNPRCGRAQVGAADHREGYGGFQSVDAR